MTPKRLAQLRIQADFATYVVHPGRRMPMPKDADAGNDIVELCDALIEGEAVWAERAETFSRQLLDLERDLRESLRGGYLFGNFDEPLDAAGLRIVRVIQQRLSDLPCECTDRTPDVGGYRCRACGGRLTKA